MATRRLIDTIPAHYTQRNLSRQEIEGELLPALPEDVRPPEGWRPRLPAPVIQLHLPQAHQEDESVAQYETRKAQRAVTWESDVQVPAAQAFLTSCAFGVMAGLLAWAAGWSWRVPVIVFAVVLALAWLWRLRLADALLWQIETITQRDLDGDRYVGRPTVNAAPVLVNPSEARDGRPHPEGKRSAGRTGRPAGLRDQVRECRHVRERARHPARAGSARRLRQEARYLDRPGRRRMARS